MSHSIEFYFEFYSPYGYLASQRIDDIATRHRCEVTWRPFMLGPAFAQTGMKPLVQIPLMDEYSLLDMKRCARLQGVAFQLPDEFPKVSLNCARAFYALVDEQPQKAKALAKAIYHAIFGLGQDGTQPELIAKLARDLGVDDVTLLESIQDPVIKERLKLETQNTIERKIFGWPFIFVDDEPFWGNDRLDQVERWLESGGW